MRRRSTAFARRAAACLVGAAWLVACDGLKGFEPETQVAFAGGDQGVNSHESDAADVAIQALLSRPNILMVMTRRAGLYEVHSLGGTVWFARHLGPDGYRYEVIRVEGENPIENQDPYQNSTLESELAARGPNPNQVTYDGYTGPDDPRIAFLDPDKVAYPFAYERIASVFDGHRAGDLLIEYQPWGLYPLQEHGARTVPGAHGQLNGISSRAPLIFAGKGAKKGGFVEEIVKSVDIAPTVAQAMGVEKTFGVNHKGQLSSDVYLKWQDGVARPEFLDGETPGRVVIIANDALSHAEILYQLSRPEADAPLPAYRWLAANGIIARHGAITNFPSNTAPSHNAIVTGAYSGHHQLIDNKFYDRDTGEKTNALVELLPEEEYVSDDVETLFEAVHRSFPNWDPIGYPLGNYTMSINDRAYKDADHSIINGVQPVDWSKCPEPDLPLPAVDNSIVTRSQAADNVGVATFYKALLGQRPLHTDTATDAATETIPCTQPPRFVLINLGLTDDQAHDTGPHSDGQRIAIEQTDRRMQIMLDIMREAGVLDDTMIVLTSDHGQCLQDITRSIPFQPALEAAGLEFVVQDAFVYLLTMRVRASYGQLVPGQSSRISIEVLNDDTRAPVENARIHLRSGDAETEATTDRWGRTQVDFTPADARTVLKVEADGLTTHTSTLGARPPSYEE